MSVRENIAANLVTSLQAITSPIISQRFGVIDYQLVCYVKGTGLDSARNNIVEAVEEKLDVDRSRGGYALDTQLITVETDDGSIAPIGGVILTVRCEYQYTRGTT